MVPDIYRYLADIVDCTAVVHAEFEVSVDQPNDCFGYLTLPEIVRSTSLGIISRCADERQRLGIGVDHTCDLVTLLGWAVEAVGIG